MVRRLGTFSLFPPDHNDGLYLLIVRVMFRVTELKLFFIFLYGNIILSANNFEEILILRNRKNVRQSFFIIAYEIPVLTFYINSSSLFFGGGGSLTNSLIRIINLGREGTTNILFPLCGTLG